MSHTLTQTSRVSPTLTRVDVCYATAGVVSLRRASVSLCRYRFRGVRRAPQPLADRRAWPARIVILPFAMIASIPAAVSSAMQEVDWIYVGRVAAAVVPIWLFGAIVGLLIPRPRLSSQGSRIGVMMSAYVPYLRQLVLWVHAGMIAREVWNWFKSGGTRAPASNKGSGVQSFDSLSRGLATVPEEEGDWYITRSDLDFFRDRVEKDTPVPGSGSWEMICDKRTDDLEYTSYRRGLPDGTTEYKSTTISYDATAPEFMDFFLNDPLRKEWDGMITHTEVVEDGNFAQREQVVRWLRSFPFSFMTDREYVLARRVFTVGDASYGITKSVVHPDAPTGSVIRVDDYHSMWRSRTIPSPRGNGELACETVLLHCENMKVPERLARFAVRHGMWGFVKKMGPSTRQFLNERRSRADPVSPRTPPPFLLPSTVKCSGRV